MRAELEALRRRKFVGVAELAAVAARVLAAAGPVQERGTVSDLPDERTVRYYLTEGLLAPAEEKQGPASVFGYLHLLQLLAVKNLQAQHLPIRKIRELVEGRTERELERLLGLDAKDTGRRTKEAGRNAALSYLESLLTQTHGSAPPPASPGTHGHAAPQRAAALSASSPPAPATGSWERIELEPGLELHVHSSYRAPAEARGLRRLTAAVVRAVESYSRKLTGKRGS
ncbi:MAG TPA: MerR family transcriptional regulator [Pyrinomonadaceae bacterium]|jgi:DNA-binding transcriptional MerR regulator